MAVTITAQDASVSAAAPHGTSGTWLLDPYDLMVGSATVASIERALDNNSSVLLQNTASSAGGPGTQNPSGRSQ